MKKNTNEATFKELYEVLNGRIYKAIANDDAAVAKQEIEILERLVKLKKSMSELEAKPKDEKPKTPLTKEKLFQDLEERLKRIRQNNQI